MEAAGRLALLFPVRLVPYPPVLLPRFTLLLLRLPLFALLTLLRLPPLTLTVLPLTLVLRFPERLTFAG